LTNREILLVFTGEARMRAPAGFEATGPGEGRLTETGEVVI
jgi:hypothetical protein